MAPPIPERPLEFTTAAVLAPYSTPREDHLIDGAKKLLVATAVIHPSPRCVTPAAQASSIAIAPKILLIQRCESDWKEFHWEISGGSTEADDKTVLSTAARELFEESGLRPSALLAFIGSCTWDDEEGSPWRIITFLAEVEGQMDGEVAPPTVTLDPREHRAAVWATEEEVKAGRVGDVVLDWTTENQRTMVLRAFEVWREAVTMYKTT